MEHWLYQAEGETQGFTYAVQGQLYAIFFGLLFKNNKKKHEAHAKLHQNGSTWADDSILITSPPNWGPIA